MSRKKDLFRLDESDDSGMNEAFPADTEKIGPEEASKLAARTAGDPVPVKAAADHPPEPKPTDEKPRRSDGDATPEEPARPPQEEVLAEALLARDRDTLKDVLKDVLKETLKEALKETLWESSKEPVVDQEDIDEATADIYDAPAEHIDAADEDEVLDALEEITEATVEEATREAIEEAAADIEEEEEILAEQRPQEMEERFESLEGLLDDHRYADFRTELRDLNPVDAADFFNELAPRRIPAVFKLLDKDTAAAVFAELEIDVQERIITALTDREISLMVEELSLDDTTDMLKELPANMVHRIMKNATPETRTDINRLLAYPEDSAGSVMTAEFIDLRRDMTCAEAIARIRKTGVDKETVYVAYVVDDHRVLQGAVPLKDLLFASADDLIEDIMDEDIICASTMDDQETVASTVAKYDMLAIPIVDREYRLVGIVTVDDAMDVMETEATEDIEKMAAISPTDKPYLKTSVFETWKKRVPWLLLLMLSATFTSTILAHYESILDAATLSLAVFVPMLTGTGGNASSQTSVTVIRGLSLGEIEMGDILRVIWKELRVAVVCGLTVAAACFAKTMLVDLKLVFTLETIEVAAIVSATMFCAVLLAKLMGVLLPIGAKRVGLDPAVMASPFITTVVDTLTLLIYVAIASAVLHI